MPQLADVRQSQYDKDTDMYSSFRQIEYERKRMKEKANLARKNLIYGIILAPILMLGWFPIMLIVARIFK